MTTFSDSAERMAEQVRQYADNSEPADGYCEKHQMGHIKVIRGEPWSGCPKCWSEETAAKAEIEGQNRHEEEQRRKRMYYLNKLSIMDEELEQATFDNFKTDTARQREVLAWARSMARYYYEGGRGNVIMTGEAGRGKSHLAYSIIKALSETQGSLAIIVNVVDLLDEIKSDFNQKQFWLNKLVEVDYLVLDDLGAEKISDWSKEIIYSILNKRTRTIITTNLTAGELVDSYGKRIASRLLKGCPKEHIMDFAGLDDERVKLWT